jgi:hypothetical protein
MQERTKSSEEVATHMSGQHESKEAGWVVQSRTPFTPALTRRVSCAYLAKSSACAWRQQPWGSMIVRDGAVILRHAQR